MDLEMRTILAAASRLLSYPAAQDDGERDAIETDLRSGIVSAELRGQLAAIADALYNHPLRRRMELYVDTFDLKEKAGLYLTAHELGDSRKRGIALIELREIIREAGFACGSEELSDHMPMLYELAAQADDSEPIGRLRQRLAFATQRVRSHLPADNPYRPLFSLLMEHIFAELPPEEMEKLEQGRERPDLDAMPYPLMYR